MINYLFPYAMYSENLEILKSRIPSYVKRIYDVKKKFKYIHPQAWLCDTFTTINTNYNMMEDPVFFDLLSQSSYHVAQFAKAYGVNNAKPKCTSCWINIAPPGSYQEFHIHPYTHFSLVYYVQTPENCGDIVFKSELHSVSMFPIPYDVSNDLNTGIVRSTPKESNVLIFPAHLQHMVEKNKSDQDRISIAMNFEMEIEKR